MTSVQQDSSADSLDVVELSYEQTFNSGVWLSDEDAKHFNNWR